MSFRLNLSPLLKAGLSASALTCAIFYLGQPKAEAQSTPTTYYVATNGNNFNDGLSASSAFATIAYAAAHTAPGDTVLVEDGTYYLSGGGYRGDAAIGSSGIAGKRITYKAQNKWKAKLIGSGTGDGSVVVGVSGSYNVIQGFEITGTDAAGINLATAGTTTSYNQAIGNYVHDIVAPCDGNGGTAINSGSGDNYGPGVAHMDIISNLVVNVTDPPGCTAPHGAGIFAAVPYVTVANNIILNGGHWAIESWHNAQHETYFGNVIVNSKQSITMGAGDSPNTGTVNDYSLVQNNIVYNSSMSAIVETGRTGLHNQYIDNLVYGGNTTIGLNNGLKAVGTVNADPQFINNTGTAAGNYRVQWTSPARGAGLALNGVMTDYDGTSRPQAGATVIGASLGTTGTTSAASVNLSDSPSSVTSGQSTVLSWTSSNAVSATLNGASVPVNGSTTMQPTSTTTYTIVVADSANQTSSSTVTVAVSGTAPTSGSVAAGVTASPASITSGQSSVITWATKNAVSSTLNGTSVPLNGSITVNPTATTTYKVFATGANGTIDWGSATVTVAAAPTGAVAAGVSASPTSIVSGQSSIITWTTKNAVSATLNGAPVPLNGSITVHPTVTTLYKVAATSSTGTTDWGSATVTVSAAATGAVAAGVSASPTAIVQGGSSVITWTTKNAVSATLNGMPVALTGSLAVKTSTTTTYKVVATSSTGTTDWGSATVTVR